MSDKPSKRQQRMTGQGEPPLERRVELTKTETSVSFSPVPPSHELERLEQVHPGITERILTMAEKEQDERLRNSRELIEIEKRNIKNINFNVRIGLFLGFGSVLVSTSLCGYFAYLGNIEAAASAAKVVIASLAAVFITGRFVQGRQKKEEPESKPF